MRFNAHVKYRNSAVVCAKTAEPIEMQFGFWNAESGGFKRTCITWEFRCFYGKGHIWVSS